MVGVRAGVCVGSRRKLFLFALLHVGMGTSQGMGCTVPEGCAIGKIQHFVM